jgi:hypothetical protein
MGRKGNIMRRDRDPLNTWRPPTIAERAHLVGALAVSIPFAVAMAVSSCLLGGDNGKSATSQPHEGVTLESPDSETDSHGV